jgi:UDP-N-acetylglucosamine--N-acetylmuramyl-(pentapeptide) pyrophosphoryl-undecaprenol N-acetylglucosamine transferase
MTASTYAVITGGGTAGHVLPALAVAEALVAAGHEPSEIHYVGAERGIETELVGPSPYGHTFLDVVGLQRGVSRHDLSVNLRLMPKLAAATRQAIALLRRLRPRVVVSVGGYASLPAAIAGRRLRVPIVAVSYDRRPGRATALTARFAAATAVAFPDSPLPRAVVTGAPLRQKILSVDRERDREAARRALGLPPDRFAVVVTGGSLGAGPLNDAVGRYVDEHRDDSQLAVRQVVGRRFLPSAPPERDGRSGVLHQVIGFDDRIELAYAAADLLVGRGGASTVAEVAATATPAVLVPWSGAAGDHQRENVRWLSDQHGAVLLPETDLASLGDVVERLRGDPDERSAMSAAAAAAGQVHRSDALVRLIERVALPGAGDGPPVRRRGPDRS